MATQFITVSIEIMHDKNLSANQKFILAEIQQLNSLERGCIATNKHFSELTGISKSGVSNAIKDLEKKGYIYIDNSKTKRNYGRVIGIHSGVPPIHSGVQGIHSGVESKENITINKTKDIYADLKDEFNISQESINEILKHRKDIGSKKPTPKALKIMLNGMKKTVSLGIKPNMKSCLRHLIDETTWQSFKPEYFDSSLNNQKTSNEKLHFIGDE